MQGPQDNPLLQQLETRMAAQHLRGQWQFGANRPQNVRKGTNGQVQIEPVPAGVPHSWKWADMLPLLRSACEAMPNSYTARRSLAFSNPALPGGTTQTLVAGMQIVPAGEIAWAHRHTMSALRFAIQGSDKAFTVVDGRPLVMQPHDLILTPGWLWHEHHNESGQDAIWMDGLDVPFAMALNQTFYEEPGEVAQERKGDAPFSPLFRAGGEKGAGGARPYRYPWSETSRILRAQRPDDVDPRYGFVLQYVNPLTGGPVLPTIDCQVQYLPPGFAGRPHRHTASAISLVVEGEGCTAFGERKLDWSQYDVLAIPNWSWHRHVNRSKSEPAILFTMNDTPILSAFGYYREESEDGATAVRADPALKLSAAE